MAVAKLWEAVTGNGRLHLSAAWAELVEALDQINFCQPPLLDPQRDIQIQNWSGFPGIEEREKFKAWLKHPGYMERWRDKAIATIQEEINAHAIPDLRPWWHRVENNRMPAFALALRTLSLWSAIWQFFARDTLGVGWRVCPHCNKVFYPPRRDRFFCTTELQQLHSKRQWAKKDRHLRRRRGAKAK